MEPSHASRSQYHHFVPQFLLKNFSYPYAPPKRGRRTPATGPNTRKGPKLRRGDNVVSCVDLSSEDAPITEMPVKRILGQTDMYRDTTKPGPEQQAVETMLSRLESDVSATVRRITADFEKGHRGLWLTRLERNNFRKFLFIMKYRGSTFHERYHHQKPEDYDAEDREQMLKYMKDRGFQRPLDVWLDNIKAIIDLDMDDELKWISELGKRMYPDDAAGAVLHMQSMYMAICTPSHPDDEFVLTDNCYHVFEGPNEFRIDLASGRLQGAEWASFHEFAPVSPKLLIVLRSFLLPSPLYDASPKAKAARDALWEKTIEKPFKGRATSILADLPVENPGNNYSEIRGGLPWPIPGEDGARRQHHSFFFRFFPIGSDHLNKINCVLLYNAGRYKSVVFRSRGSFLKTLEGYMTAEPSVIGKRVVDSPGDPKLGCLRKLAAVMKRMGSSAKPVWDEFRVPDPDSAEGRELMWEEFKRTELPKRIPDDDPSQFMQTYRALDGSNWTLVEDMEVSAFMVKLRIQLDVQSAGADERLRRRNRGILIEAYLHCPPRRVWLYLKRWRVMEFPDCISSHDKDMSETLYPEDIIAKARSIIQAEELTTLMFNAVGNDFQRRKSPEFDPWSGQNDLEHYMKLQDMVFNNRIRDCGIQEIADFAIYSESEARGGGTSTLDGLERILEDWSMESAARAFTKLRFRTIFRERLERDLLEKLEDVIFGVVYPTFLDFEE